MVKFVLREAESIALAAAATDRDVYSSRVAMVEVAKAVARHDHGADPAGVLGRVSWVELDEDIAGVAAATGGPLFAPLMLSTSRRPSVSRPRSRPS